MTSNYGEYRPALQRPIEPLVWFDRIDRSEANLLLAKWGHKMGPIARQVDSEICHVLIGSGEPVALTAASTLIREHVGGGLMHLTRENTIELSRLCAARPGLCRIALRIWREFVFPGIGFPVAISYQDADLHNGATYRFDGWRRVGFSHSGTGHQAKEVRQGLAESGPRMKGRDKWIWQWPPEVAQQ